jgi:hypothetical protein
VADTVISLSYNNLATTSGEGGEIGYRSLPHYPFKDGMNFQAVDFPNLARKGKVYMLGNNQAFFFIKNPKGNTDPNNMQLDTGALKTLLENIAANGTFFMLMIDADVFANPANFVDKYQHLRPEPDEGVRRALLTKEVELISGFVQNQGITKLVKEILQESGALSKSHLEQRAAIFTNNNFKLRGVETFESLTGAVWEITNPDGTLLYAKQIYSPQTDNIDRTWQLGGGPALKSLIEKGHTGAHEISTTVNRMHALPKIDLTFGYTTPDTPQPFKTAMTSDRPAPKS